mgnify:CR=1 FL=1
MSDLFGFLDKMASGDYRYVEQMSEEDVKKINTFVLLMWEGEDDNIIRNIITDQYCNDVVFSLSKHPRLLLKLFVAANDGLGRTKFQFVKSVSNQESKIYKLIATYYGCGYHEAKDIHRLLSKDDIKELKEIYEYDN